MRNSHSSFLAGLFLLLTALWLPTESQAARVSYSYDSLNRVTSMIYGSRRIEYSYDSAGNITRVVTPPVIPGDINNNGSVELDDAILVSQILISILPRETVIVEADVNTDQKIGIAEVIYILRVIGDNN